jgi:hypothetical protein
MSEIKELVEAVRCSSIPEMQQEEIAEILVEYSMIDQYMLPDDDDAYTYK